MAQPVRHCCLRALLYETAARATEVLSLNVKDVTWPNKRAGPAPRAGRSSSSTTGWTLPQLRHSAITHLAEDKSGLPLLMAKSRHDSLRSLRRYARPDAAHDPARRRRYSRLAFALFLKYLPSRRRVCLPKNPGPS